ncbi:hypothetical protein [Actinocatenispora rupis]|uniref:Uncharacterized protein n=1 Tax=Actinocatenispora rupis TaxID=519421 RepID=A0A8J3J0E3_9ACTN|nr:hypothetical protein [Actinocatenispora rupis]GID09196.1 hypothetical protein Aru02nite_00850 [Actinocatenispora rupis]
MVLTALIVETGIAVMVAGGLAAWSRRHFASRGAEQIEIAEPAEATQHA